MINMVKKKFKRNIKRWFFPYLPLDSFEFKYPFGIPELPKVYLHSFGDKNPDKTFYVIWRDKLGAGFFSNFTQVVSHVLLAESFGMVPIVDYCNFKTLFNISGPVNGSTNAWEYYFKQLSPYTLEDVYSSKKVVIADGDYPHDIFCRTNKEYQNFWKKWIILQDNITDELKIHAEHFQGQRILGVHLRGTDMNTTAGHPFAPTEKQTCILIDQLLEKHQPDKIFFLTDDKKYLHTFQKRYGNMLFTTNAYKTAAYNPYNDAPRENHRYLLGKEVLIDSLLLSKVNWIICGPSAVSTNAIRLSTCIEKVYKIDNGFNSKNILAAKYLYRIKKTLPPRYGGLPGKVLCMETNSSTLYS